MSTGRRKGWDQLSAAYRNRLRKNGITEAGYRRGESLSKARGHISNRHENTRRHFWRIVDSSGFDRDEVQDVIDTIGFDEANDILDYREMALTSNDPIGRHLAAGAMRNLYGQYEGLVPRQWLYYHGGGR